MIINEIHKVAIVVEDDFCKEKLFSIARNMHVWLLESESNLKSAKDFYSEFDSKSNDLLADGISLTDKTKEVLQEFGFSNFKLLDSYNFIATK